MSKNKLTIALISLILVIILAFVFIRPIMVGYSTYQTLASSNLTSSDYLAELNQIQEELDNAEKQNLESSEEKNIYSQEIKKLQILVMGLNETLSHSNTNHESNLQSIQQDFDIQLGIANAKLDRCETKLKGLDNDYEDLVENTAENICCKMKVDNSRIDSYDVKSDKIVCSEDGKYDLDCDF